MDGLINRIASEAPLLLLVVAAALVISVPVVLWRIRTGNGFVPAAWRTVLEVGALGSLAVIMAVTLSTFGGGGAGEVNWIPFKSLFDNMAIGEFWVGILVVDLVGNLLLYLPLGLFIGLRFARLPMFAWAVSVTAISATTELFQGVFLGRSADVTDVIMNSLGGVLGFAIARILQRMARVEGYRPAASI